jgi:hypothetical protein
VVFLIPQAEDVYRLKLDPNVGLEEIIGAINDLQFTIGVRAGTFPGIEERPRPWWHYLRHVSAEERLAKLHCSEPA